MAGFLLEDGQSHGVSSAGGVSTRAAFFGFALVVRRPKDRGCAAVCLSDDPKLLALAGSVVA